MLKILNSLRQFVRRPLWPAVAAAFMATLLMAGSVPSAQQAPVRLNRIIEKFIAGQPSLGTSTYHTSLESAMSMGRSDNEWVMIPIEHHGAWSAEALRIYLLGLTNKAAIAKQGNIQPNVTPIVMVSNEPTELQKRAFDSGVMGAMFMAVESKQQALKLVRSMRFHGPRKGKIPTEPSGLRFHGSAGAGAEWWWGVSRGEYTRRADVWPLNTEGELLAAMEIETAAGLKNVDEIASTPGVGAIFIGPGDLATSLGVDSQDPAREAAIQTILKACLAHNVPCGIGASKEDGSLDKRIKEGFKWFDLHDSPFMIQ